MRLYLTLILYSLLGVAYAATDTLYLIPQPKYVEVTKGWFNISYMTDPSNYGFSNQIKRDTVCEQIIHRAIVDVKERMQPVTREELHSCHLGSKLHIAKRTGAEYDTLLKQLRLNPPFELGNEGYILLVTNNRFAYIIAHTDEGIFYGAQTFAQLAKASNGRGNISSCVIYDKPDFKIRAWQDDISRGPIPTLDFLKEQVRTMASYKMNAFMLYMENVVKLSKHPNLAPPDALTIDELKELIAYAKQYHVMVIGNFQSYGHFEKTLCVPGYEHLGENAFTLSPAKEEAYQFLSDAYSELVPLFDYEYFHVNCDEVMLGDQGASKQLVDSLGESGVYSYHLNRVNELLKPYHKKMMLWGDMVAKDSVAISKLPKDAMVVSWGYGPMEKRADDLKPLVKAGVDFMVAPGVSCWSRIYPDISRSIINIYHYLHDGYQYGAKGFINTTWDDDGQNLFNNNWYGLLLGAHWGWNVPRYENADSAIAYREEHVAAFNRAFNRLHFGTTYNVAALMRSVADLNYGPVKNCMSTAAYWQTPLADKTFYAERWEEDNLKLLHRLDSLQRHELETAAHNVQHNLHQVQMLYMATAYSHALAKTNLLNVQMRPYASAVDTSYPRYIFNEEIANSFFARGTLAKSYRHFWGFENRPVYADTVTGYFLAYRDRLMSLSGTCILQPGDTLINGTRPIRLKSAFDNLPVYYTLNGTEPTAQSTLYTQPVMVNSNVRIKARVIDSVKMHEVVEDSFVFHRGIGKLYKLNTEWTPKNPAYAAGGKLALLDGRRGNPKDFSDGRWQGYLDKDISVELDMGTATTLTKITMGFGQLQPYGIMLPAQIEVSVSNDGTNYTFVKTATHDVPGTKEERVLRDFEIDLTGTTARYIKVVAKNYGPLPKGHFAAGRPSWLFADEIIIE